MASDAPLPSSDAEAEQDESEEETRLLATDGSTDARQVEDHNSHP